MADSFTIYWARDRAEALKSLPKTAGMSKVLFGGPHQSQPSFRRAGVKAGDLVYPISISHGRLQILGMVSVNTIVDAADVMPSQFGLHVQNNNEQWILDSGWPEEFFYKVLCVTCVDEALLALTHDGPFDALYLSEQATDKLTFQNRRSMRKPKGVEDGKIKMSLPFQGIYRLSTASADAFSQAVRGYET